MGKHRAKDTERHPMSTTTLQPMLFDDSPRVRQSDPVTSHVAADKSQKAVGVVRQRVLDILADNGPLTAAEVCDAYMIRTARHGWSKVHHETPRKRLSDLKREGYVVDTAVTRDNPEGSPEVVVALKAALA